MIVFPELVDPDRLIPFCLVDLVALVREGSVARDPLEVLILLAFLLAASLLLRLSEGRSDTFLPRRVFCATRVLTEPLPTLPVLLIFRLVISLPATTNP